MKPVTFPPAVTGDSGEQLLTVREVADVLGLGPRTVRDYVARGDADLLGMPWEAARGHFTPVYVDETLTLGFASRDRFDSHHYCFRVSDAEFNAIFGC
jgi:hypothetical protein